MHGYGPESCLPGAAFGCPIILSSALDFLPFWDLYFLGLLRTQGRYYSAEVPTYLNKCLNYHHPVRGY